jgi:GNAT superfamily N-acetyltransferase
VLLPDDSPPCGGISPALLRIREASIEDVPLILSFIQELAEYEREPGAVRATEDDLIRDGFSTNPKFRVIIAESAGTPAGMAFFFHHYSTWQGRHGLFLEDFFVRPQFRGKGVGKTLMVHLAQIAIAENCYGMRWEVLDWNTNAIDVYQRLGAHFREHGRVMQITGEDLKRLSETEL